MQLVPSPRPAGDDRSNAAARLRKLIARKRAEKARLERDIADVRVSLAELFSLRERTLEPVDDEIHEHFGVVLQDARLAPEERAEIRALYRDLMMDATISPRVVPGVIEPEDEPEPEDEYDEPCPCPECTAERAAASGFDEGDAPWPGGADADARIPVPPRREPGDSRSLRDLYRDLASRYHPDKAGDEETRVEHERLMREINGAYQAGDLDGLAALSRELGFEIAGDGLLEVLAGQYERLKAEVRALRRDRLGDLVVETRRCDKRGAPAPLVQMAEDIHHSAAQLELLAGVFRAFRSGETDPDEFLIALLGDPDEDIIDEADLDEVIGALADLLARSEAPPSRRRTARPGRARRTRTR